jgi:small subunit ribosomal protein S8
LVELFASEGGKEVVLTDPIADMLARIRNANKALHDTVAIPSSRVKVEIARLLKEEGYIRDYRVHSAEEWQGDHPLEKPKRSFDTLVIELKYGRNRERVLTDLKRVSKPGRRIYARKDRMPRVLGGMGTAIMSTSSGVMTSRSAEQKGVGGEVICFVW